MRHQDTVQAEFTRQATTFRQSPTLNAEEVTTRVGQALGSQVERVLDVACGPGLLLPVLSRRAATVVGVDLTRANLGFASQVETLGAVHLVRGLAESLPFEAASFDAAVLRLALHHFEEPDTVLAAVRRLVRPGGRLVVLDVLGPESDETARVRDAIERLRDPSHTALLSRSGMGAAISRAGFELGDATLWSQERVFSDWAAIMNEPRRMADLEQVLRALALAPDDPTGLKLRETDAGLAFTYDWGLFVARAD